MSVTFKQVVQINGVCHGGGILIGGGKAVLITKEDSLYRDEFFEDGKRCNYRGQGQIGNQSLNDSRNRTLYAKLKEGYAVPMYERIRENEYELLGHYALDDDVYTIKEKDANEQIRDVLIFPLVRIAPAQLGVFRLVNN